MKNETTDLCFNELEDKLLNTPVSDDFLFMLKGSSIGRADITELMYQYYLGSNDYNNAIYFLELADKFNDSYAQLHLASLYQQGKYCLQDKNRALALFQKSAHNGEPEAQYELGLSLLLSGNNDDFEQSVYWLNESFLNGNDDSKILLDSLNS
ncbi:tetratricopeptide repeat protein [Photobacterium lipolyticum]|uniref:Sel1 repeat family protein n=1 Tax=Photobacterium lipolyticum TaxID=266810 RepID=A0A2T3MWK7_9GAMM|nr:sel1 repeat family protein [Photobacterium lipolyticum]PSW04349.1 sel1 repeat family protein [Photobacterium lipolyticum]